MILYTPTRITCDHEGCPRKLIEGDRMARSHPAALVHQAEGLGWWIVAAPLTEPHWRGQKHYCPDHAREHLHDRPGSGAVPHDGRSLVVRLADAGVTALPTWADWVWDVAETWLELRQIRGAEAVPEQLAPWPEFLEDAKSLIRAHGDVAVVRRSPSLRSEHPTGKADQT